MISPNPSVGTTWQRSSDAWAYAKPTWRLVNWKSV